MAEPGLNTLNLSGVTSRSSHRKPAVSSWLRLTKVVLATGWLSAATFAKADFLTLPADQDAFAASYGAYSDPALDVGYRTFVGPVTYEYRSAVRFPLPPSLNTAVIDHATLKLLYFGYWGSQNMRLVRVHPLLQDWNESGQFFNASRGGAIAEAWVGPAYRWIEWDVTAAARTWATNPSQNFGLMLVADPVGANDNAFRFHSREAADPASRPVLEIHYYLPPQITLQPQEQAVEVGNPVTLTVAATGSPTLYYQWWKDGQPLTNVISTNVLTFASVRSTDAGVYSVVVMNSVGSVQSSNATLAVMVPPTEFRGSVAVTLAPPECAAAGAMWRVNGGAWLNSGMTVANIPAGNQLVEFLPVAGWRSPAAHQVRVIGNHVVSNAVSYTPVASVSVGSIPTQRVYDGTPSEFRVFSRELGAGATFAIAIGTPTPTGALSFDPATGLFRYIPAATNKQSFPVTFTATLGTNTISQVVSFQPVPGLPPERAVFGLTPGHPMPSDESKDYIMVNTIAGDAPESFNNVTRSTRSITISGKTVVFQQGHVNGLYNAYNENDDIKELAIHAEKIVVRSPLRLPQTAVTIYARELHFEGPDASIDTTPRSLVTRPAQFAAGAHGLKAGDIVIYAERFASDPVDVTRFVMRGGEGQPGGLGRDGEPGMDKSTCGNWPGIGDPVQICPWPNNATAAQFTIGPWIQMYWPDQSVYDSTSAWQPGNGDNGQPGGKPGNGGAGGAISSALGLAGSSFRSGGLAGTGSWNPGGRGGNPNPAYKVLDWSGSWQIVTTFRSQPGQNVSSPPPDVAIGANGSFSSVGHSLSWLSPYALRMILAHAKDAYLCSYVDTVDPILAEYEAILMNYQNLAAWQQLDEKWQFQFSEMLLEIQTLRHRTAAHLDYFGNPAGWVPMLSFEANKAAYETEIGRAIRVMYLSYWIGHAASNLQAKVNALDATKDSTVDEIESLKTQYSESQSRIPVLEAESAALAVDEQRRLEDLKWLEKRLEARAQANVEERHRVPEWKKALGVAAAICKVVPVYQPALAAVGTGMEAVANHKPDDPMATVNSLASVARSLNDGALKASAENWRTNVNVIQLTAARTNGLEGFKAQAQALGRLAEPIANKLRELEKNLKETEVPKNELEAELAKLKAESPEFQDIAAKLKDLTVRKEVFAQDLNQTMQAVSTLAAGITHDLLSLDALNRSLADGNRVIDQRALAYLNEMDRRARERLLKYHYWMAKAYEYRLLKPYPGELNLTAMFDRITAIAGTSTNHLLTASDFDSLKAIYEEQLSTITSVILTDYNNNRPELSVPIRFNLTSAELAQLNAGQPLTINLRDLGIFPLSEENIRIVDWQVDDIRTHLAGGGLGTFAFMDLNMEHSGLSTLASKGQYYLFRHYNQNTEQPIVWGARFDAFNSTVDPIAPSAASQSLLASLLGLAGIGQTNLLLYSRPSAWADIVVSKAVYTSSGADIVIDSLRLKLQYDFVRKRTDQAALTVTATGGIQPYFIVGSQDMNSRQDALGAFDRTYSKNTAVTINAPLNYGEWRFQKWTDRFGNDLPGGPVTNAALALALGDNKAIQAQYSYANTNDVDVDTMGDAWEIQYFSSTTHADLTTDHDGDGVPDYQEAWSGTNPLLADSDGDGLTDWQEFIAGTLGNDPASKFTASLASDPSMAGSFILSWNTVENRVYRVFAGPGPSGSWTHVYGVWGDGTPKSFTSQFQGDSNQFFRVSVELPVSQ